jgi:hypothetical protein
LVSIKEFAFRNQRRIWHTAALGCELIGVVLLFFFAWPQPSFETYDVFGIGPSASAQQIIAQKRWYSVSAVTGLLFLLTGCGIQLGLIWTDKRT